MSTLTFELGLFLGQYFDSKVINRVKTDEEYAKMMQEVCDYMDYVECPREFRSKLKDIEDILNNDECLDVEYEITQALLS